jgi:Rps23 Pro-64 3,4-dihydroxylase Tpa1-like proline 4-hydroxylase
LLPADELARLPTLLKLRDALYSSAFRRFLRDVTGCGPLSGVKADMSCNNYGPRCRTYIFFFLAILSCSQVADFLLSTDLLNHDDVIGTRRVSFILYLPLANPEWKPSYGGALELYPLADPPTDPPTPASKPSVSIPPSFNQFAFFEVQPGRSFHSVEEVVFHPLAEQEPGDVGQRISISGWFHRPTEEEEEWEGTQPDLQKSSLQQLVRS